MTLDGLSPETKTHVAKCITSLLLFCNFHLVCSNAQRRYIYIYIELIFRYPMYIDTLILQNILISLSLNKKYM